MLFFLWYRAFRRLLFQDLSSSAAAGAAGKKPSTHVSAGLKVPDRKVLLQLDFIDDLRPSTLLAYLICCGPNQLPLPHEALGKDVSYYIDGLLDCNNIPPIAQSPNNHHSHASPFLQSLRGLYYHKTKEGWKKIKNEKRNWEDVQQALDILFQRISVAEGEHKATMRLWYEAIIDIGSHYFR